ncbi:MAG: hypothetical protein NVS3B26_15360 [Mycobacteriales bacterium]
MDGPYASSQAKARGMQLKTARLGALGRRRAIVLIVGLLTLAWTVDVGLSAVRHQRGTAVSLDARTRELSFRLASFSGGELTSAQLQGRPFILNFYASWCGVCQQEMPDFQRVAQDVKGAVRIIGVNPQDHDTDAAQAALVRSTGVTYPTVRDPDSAFLRLFNTSGALPTTVFVDASGTVVGVYNGALTEGKVVRFLRGYFGVVVNSTLPDRTRFRTPPSAKPAHQ